jgi:hypothetical protein
MDIKMARRGRVTEATVAWLSDDMHLEGHGSTLRSKNDVNLDTVGVTIALGRALQDLGRKIEANGHAQCVTKEEYARVMHLEDQRAEERAIKAVIKRHGNS